MSSSLSRQLLRPASRCISLSRPLQARLSIAQRLYSSSQKQPGQDGPELGVGELQGASFKIEPLRRVGEDDKTKRARLTYQCRKRGTLESDLLLSTFAAVRLPTMSSAQLTEFDLFLDENDWDIYYWATQNESTSSTNPASPSSAAADDVVVAREAPRGEWAQTVGNFKPAHRPVPARWRDSEILELLRAHVRARSVDGSEGMGMGFMPALDTKE